MSEPSVIFLQVKVAVQEERIAILREALLEAKHELVVLQILNPGIQGVDHLEATIERIQAAMRYER
jgi:hypothetical protein